MHNFLNCDMSLFQGIIGDLFPGVVLPKADYGAMEGAMRDACAARNLQPTGDMTASPLPLPGYLVSKRTNFPRIVLPLLALPNLQPAGDKCLSVASSQRVGTYRNKPS